MKPALIERLYAQPAMYETARAIRYDGIGEVELTEKLAPLKEKYGMAVTNALHELIREKDGFFTLLPHVRKMCSQLLGPAPEHPLGDFIRLAPSSIMGEENAQRWQEEYRKKKAQEQAEQEAEPKKRKKGKSR